MYSKIIKNMRKKGQVSGKIGESARGQAKSTGNAGFHAKQNSSTGAARARSIGNRNIKPSNSK